MDEIINRVSGSGILSIDLDEYFPTHPIIEFDIKDWLWQGLILKEKDFRDKLAGWDWARYLDTSVTIYCSADAIVPYWAYMLIAARLQPYARDINFGNKDQYLTNWYNKALGQLNPEDYRDRRVVVKGCGDKPVPVSAYMEITRLLTPVVRAIMYGEPCSTVPVYKRAAASAQADLK